MTQRWWLHWTKVVFPHPVVPLSIMKISSVKYLGCVQALPKIHEISIMLLLYKMCCFLSCILSFFFCFLYPFLKVNNLIAKLSYLVPWVQLLTWTQDHCCWWGRVGMQICTTLKKNYLYIYEKWRMGGEIKLKEI